jgi:glycosyltransferase involved in cell wall biosynthesis
VGGVVTVGTSTVGFGANAVQGGGGQGEFLRAMMHVMERWKHATVYARAAHSNVVPCVSLPFQDGWRRRAFDAVLAVPGLRRRVDWLTSLDDEDFDERLSTAARPVDLFDGVMGQCVTATSRRPLRSAKRVVTSLNTHIQHLDRVMRDESRRVGSTAPQFVSPRMIRRVLDELHRAAAVRVCSGHAKQTFLEHGVAPDRVHVIPIGIDLEHFQPVGKGDDVFRVLVVSSVTPRKGVHYALEAFERAQLPNAERVIIGGTGDPWSRRLIEDYTRRCTNVRLEHRDVSREPVEQHYGRASVLVHAAVEDGFGLVIPQALACGRPVVATRESGASEVVRDGETGFVVPARDVDVLVERLRLLHADAPLRERMGQSAPATVAHLSFAAHAEAVCRLYSRVLGQS